MNTKIKKAVSAKKPKPASPSAHLSSEALVFTPEAMASVNAAIVPLEDGGFAIQAERGFVPIEAFEALSDIVHNLGGDSAATESVMEFMVHTCLWAVLRDATR